LGEQAEPRLELSTVRGIACVALVAYHVVGPASDSGMHLPDGSYWHAAMNSLDFLRMPMFSVLAGYLYAAKRVDAASIVRFAHKKALRLLAPLIFVTTIMFLLRQSVYHEQTTYAAALLFHYQHLWFLQAILLIFAGIALWDAYAPPTWVGLCIAAFASAMISRTFSVTDFLSLNGALYLMPFFALGMILRTESAILQSPKLAALAWALVSIVMVSRQAAHAFGGVEITRVSLPAALCGISAAYLMLVSCPKLRLFEAIGGFSFTIYLWHSIAASAARQAIGRYSHLPDAVEFTVLLIVGVVVPICIHLIVRRVPVLCTLAAGLRSSSPLPVAALSRSTVAVISRRISAVHPSGIEPLPERTP
jgi:peptidoglycan/LPS O-acetylase OafA/YrhL